MDYAVIVKGLNREGVHLLMRIRPASGERSVKDRKAGVRAGPFFLRPLSVIAREYPIAPACLAR